MSGEALISSLGPAGEAGPAAGTPPLNAAGIERRREPRTPTNWIAMIQRLDGTEVPCTVKDVSKSGARLGMPEAVALPESFFLRVLGYDFLFRVRLIWRNEYCAGVRIEQFDKRPPPTVAPEEQKSVVEPAETYAALGRRRSRYSRF